MLPTLLIPFAIGTNIEVIYFTTVNAFSAILKISNNSFPLH